MNEWLDIRVNRRSKRRVNIIFCKLAVRLYVINDLMF